MLVINTAKVTRTAAAFVAGCQALDPKLPICGIILNNVSGQRHEEVLRAAIKSACAIPVVGTIRKAAVNPLPERYLGLVPPQEHADTAPIHQDLLKLADGFDLDAIISIARSAPSLSFYYPENLEQLAQGGADLAPISSLRSSALPDGLRALYIGGGFPEKHADALSSNRSFLQSIRQAALRGLPIYAECGGRKAMATVSSVWTRRIRFSLSGLFFAAMSSTTHAFHS